MKTPSKRPVEGSISTSTSPEVVTASEQALEAADQACGFAYRPWCGADHWSCDRCLLYTFDRSEAQATKCKRTGSPVSIPEKTE